MKVDRCRRQSEAIANFCYEGMLVDEKIYGNGQINDTFLLTFDDPFLGKEKVILQRINKDVNTDPVALMENIQGVTSHLREKILAEGGDAERGTLNLILTVDGKPYYLDSDGEYWRSYRFVDNAVSYEQVRKQEDFYQCALTLGRFESLLADYPIDSLHEIIPKFHNTKARYEAFERAVSEDVAGRASRVDAEIEFVRRRKDLAGVLQNMRESGELPLRVTHNDTKLNHFMLDKKTGKGLCIVDLDTVMPGLSAYDFGDSIRYGANTALEDEWNLEKVSCDMNLYETYVRGYLDGCAIELTEKEIEMLPMGAKTMTFEYGMRFLTDYLNGDIYFKIHREQHNLDRARVQFALLEDMEANWSTMQEIVKRNS